MLAQDRACPCGSEQYLAQCCGPVVAGDIPAQTAASLMRSRYTAFVLNDTAHLARSWHSATRPENPAAPPGVQWRRLRIRQVIDGGVDDASGHVEFVAHFRTPDGKRDMLHERSRFGREQGRWVYIDGELF